MSSLSEIGHDISRGNRRNIDCSAFCVIDRSRLYSAVEGEVFRNRVLAAAARTTISPRPVTVQDLLLTSDGRTEAGYRYTFTAFSIACSTVLRGLRTSVLAFVTPTPAHRVITADDRMAAIQTFNAAIRARFDNFGSRRLILDTADRLITGFRREHNVRWAPAGGVIAAMPEHVPMGGYEIAGSTAYVFAMAPIPTDADFVIGWLLALADKMTFSAVVHPAIIRGSDGAFVVGGPNYIGKIRNLEPRRVWRRGGRWALPQLAMGEWLRSMLDAARSNRVSYQDAVNIAMAAKSRMRLTGRSCRNLLTSFGFHPERPDEQTLGEYELYNRVLDMLPGLFERDPTLHAFVSGFLWEAMGADAASRNYYFGADVRELSRSRKALSAVAGEVREEDNVLGQIPALPERIVSQDSTLVEVVQTTIS